MAPKTPKTPSTPNGGGSSSDDMKLTPGDTKFFTTLFKYLPKSLEVDWEGFSKEMGFKDGLIAKVRFRQIRNKHGLVGLDTPGTPGTPATPGSAKSTKASGGGALKANTDENKVTKPGRKKGAGGRPRGKAAKALAAAAADGAADGDNDEKDETDKDSVETAKTDDEPLGKDIKESIEKDEDGKKEDDDVTVVEE
ncbi:hypothetical protein F4777DRAFT_97402 [Nemania sp. FL0916]|nr:hypothetical protein F4777DRAFT_97402 [Nemania sp. FL0916]